MAKKMRDSDDGSWVEVIPPEQQAFNSISYFCPSCGHAGIEKDKWFAQCHACGFLASPSLVFHWGDRNRKEKRDICSNN